MGTNITPEVSKKSKYWISRHRYYELKHFCLQYPAWKMEAQQLTDGYNSVKSSLSKETVVSAKEVVRMPEEMSMAVLSYRNRIKLVVEAAGKIDYEFANYILRAVTENLSYTYLKEKLGMPFSKNEYYEEYRKFFWILDKMRD